MSSKEKLPVLLSEAESENFQTLILRQSKPIREIAFCLAVSKFLNQGSSVKSNSERSES